MSGKRAGTLDAWAGAASGGEGTDDGAASNAKRARLDETAWADHDDTLVYKRYGPAVTATKMAAFDFDDTLVATKSGKKFAGHAGDWQYWHPTAVVKKLQELHRDGYRLVMFSNQKGISSDRKDSKKRSGPGEKERSILGRFDQFLEQTGLPFMALLASDDDHFRKPNVDSFTFFETAHNGGVKIDRAASFFCGDAAGRVDGWKAGKKKDFACTDREFALNLGIGFHTPEELFLGEAKTLKFEHEFNPRSVPLNLPLFSPTSRPLVSDKQELVIMVGWPGSGKSSFAKKFLETKGYVRVNRDELNTAERCMAAVRAALAAKKSAVLDNTSPDKGTRRTYIEIAKEHGVPTRIFHMATSRELANHLNYFRMKTVGIRRVPDIAYNMYKNKFEQPSEAEGVDEVKTINWVPNFASDELREQFFMFT